MKKQVNLNSFLPLLFVKIFLCLSLSAQAKISIKKIKDDLSQKSENVFKLGAKIRSLEKNLGSKNDDYLSNMTRVRKIENVIGEIKVRLQRNTKNINSKYQTTKKLWQYYLINQQDSESEDYIFRKRALIQSLGKQIKTLKSAKVKSKALMNTLASYEQQLIDYRENSNSLYQLIIDLENNKKNLSQKYISALEKKNELEEKLEVTIAKQKAYRQKKRTQTNMAKIPVKLMLPLRDFASYKGSKKGMTFKYKKVAPLHATESGKVVYSGELASYGKVIMIDHGHDIRSVLLGDLNITSKKGDVVQKGQVLGYVNSDAGITKTLYYEVRKKNVAQNTLKLLKKIKTI